MQVRSIPRPFIRTPRLAGLAAAAWLAAALAGCASSSTPARDWTQQLQRWSDAPLVLLGEQHDAAAHQAWQQATVQQLATQERLAALVIEMAPRTGSTASLARDASEDAVQQALQWQDAAWPWPRYRGVVMAAVRAGVPVLGGNLPRADMKQAMRNQNLDTHLPPEAWQRQLDAIREGHCGLLPDTQLAPMARIQLARDASMAEVAKAAIRPGKTVVLVAGRGHVLRGWASRPGCRSPQQPKWPWRRQARHRWRTNPMWTGCRRRTPCRPRITAQSCARSSGTRRHRGRMRVGWTELHPCTAHIPSLPETHSPNACAGMGLLHR